MHERALDKREKPTMSPVRAVASCCRALTVEAVFVTEAVGVAAAARPGEVAVLNRRRTGTLSRPPGPLAVLVLVTIIVQRVTGRVSVTLRLRKPPAPPHTPPSRSRDKRMPSDAHLRDTGPGHAYSRGT